MINDKNNSTMYKYLEKVKQEGCYLHNIINFRTVPIITRGVRNVKN
jgi:hypothetical protein